MLRVAYIIDCHSYFSNHLCFHLVHTIHHRVIHVTPNYLPHTLAPVSIFFLKIQFVAKCLVSRILISWHGGILLCFWLLALTCFGGGPYQLVWEYMTWAFCCCSSQILDFSQYQSIELWHMVELALSKKMQGFTPKVFFL